MRSLAEDVEGHFSVNDFRLMYKAMRNLRIVFLSCRLVTDMDRQRGRWVVYCEYLNMAGHLSGQFQQIYVDPNINNPNELPAILPATK